MEVAARGRKLASLVNSDVNTQPLDFDKLEIMQNIAPQPGVTCKEEGLKKTGAGISKGGCFSRQEFNIARQSREIGFKISTAETNEHCADDQFIDKGSTVITWGFPDNSRLTGSGLTQKGNDRVIVNSTCSELHQESRLSGVQFRKSVSVLRSEQRNPFRPAGSFDLCCPQSQQG